MGLEIMNMGEAPWVIVHSQGDPFDCILRLAAYCVEAWTKRWLGELKIGHLGYPL